MNPGGDAPPGWHRIGVTSTATGQLSLLECQKLEYGRCIVKGNEYKDGLLNYEVSKIRIPSQFAELKKDLLSVQWQGGYVAFSASEENLDVNKIGDCSQNWKEICWKGICHGALCVGIDQRRA